MNDGRAATWTNRLRRLAAYETAKTAVADWIRADRAHAARKRAQQRWAREVMRPLVEAA
jgi:hypothetical protein